MTTTRLRWDREEPGWYTTELHGERAAVVQDGRRRWTVHVNVDVFPGDTWRPTMRAAMKSAEARLRARVRSVRCIHGKPLSATCLECSEQNAPAPPTRLEHIEKRLERAERALHLVVQLSESMLRREDTLALRERLRAIAAEIDLETAATMPPGSE